MIDTFNQLFQWEMNYLHFQVRCEKTKSCTPTRIHFASFPTQIAATETWTHGEKKPNTENRK